MNLTYLAVSGGIVLATILVYALLSWRRAPQPPEPDAQAHAEPERAPAEPVTRRQRQRPPASERPS